MDETMVRLLPLRLRQQYKCQQPQKLETGGHDLKAGHNCEKKSEYDTLPRMLCNGNGAISNLQTEIGFVKDFRYSLCNSEN